MARASLAWASALVLGVACWAPEVAPDPGGEGQPGEVGLRFVEGGVVVPAEVGAEGIALTEGRVLVVQPWRPGEAVEVLGRHLRARARAPGEAECVLLFRIGVGGQAPEAVAFSDDGARLWVQRGRRDDLVVDGWRGEEVDAVAGVPVPAETLALPPGCPAEQPAGAAVRGPDGRLAVVEGPFVERSGETGWRLAVFR